MAGDQEQLQKELHEAREKLKEEKMRAAVREKNLEEVVKKARVELEAKEKQLRKLTGGGNEGNMKWDVNVASVGKDLIFSPPTVIGGLPFRLGCKTEKNPQEWFFIYLYCNENAPSKTWSARVDFTLSLAAPNWNQSFCHTFDASATGCGCKESSHYWVDIQGYNHGCLSITAEVKVISYYKNAIVDFTSADPYFTDVILLVGGKPFHVNRKHIALHANYFKNIFTSDFAEKNQPQIKLDEIDAKEFEEMLAVIYPQRKKVTEATVVSLLRLADFFDVHVVRMECIEFLKTSASFTPAAKLLLSDEFRLSELQHHVLDAMKNANDLRTVISSADFANLSIGLKNSILERHFKLSNLNRCY